MPIKILAAPGDHRNDFDKLEAQTNEWIAQVRPQIISMHTSVTAMPNARDSNAFMMTLLVHYEPASA